MTRAPQPHDPRRLAAERREHTRKQLLATGALTLDGLIAQLQEIARTDPELRDCPVAFLTTRCADGDAWDVCEPLRSARPWDLHFDHGACTHGVLLSMETDEP